MTPISSTLNVMAYKADQEENGPLKVKKDFDWDSCKDLAIKDR